MAQSPSHSTISGNLSLEDGEIVVGANVAALSPTDSTIITYSISNIDGIYPN
ncbi:hypothetical protein QYZ87_03595 [Porphyromonadaceae bacterium W3.11]|nr:hypothetical protein [Porphyromonadaceae bacterium W3.11]